MKKFLVTGTLVGVALLGGILIYSLYRSTPITSKDFLESGKKYFEQKKFPEATIQFLNAVQRDPQSRDARYMLALSYLNQLDMVNAALQLRSLLEYYPNDFPASLQLGDIYLAGGPANPELFRQAQEIAAGVLAKDAQNVDALILSGNASAGLQDYRSSVDFFEKVLSLDPHNTAAFVSLGTSQVLQRNYPQAEQAFLKAREISPKDKSTLISLANYYRAVRDNAKAEAVFKDALSIYPTDRDVYLQVVTFYDQTGRFDEADRILRDVQSTTPKDPAPSFLLADLYAAKDRPADARKLLLDLKERFPDNLDVATQLALSFLQDQPDRAKLEIDRILKADPNSVVGNVLLGELQFISGNYDAAGITLGKAPAVDSPFPQAHFFLGNIAMRKGQLDQALFHYQKSLDVNSNYLPARVALAEVFMDQGRIADSREEIRKALDIRSDFVPARILQATLDSSGKNDAGAEQDLNQLAKEQPDNAIVYRQMGLYYDSRGRPAEAEKSLLRALSLRPDSQEIFRDLILFYIRQKQTDKAIQTVNAIPDNKKQAFHYELIGLAYSQAGNLQEAEKAFNTALEKDPTRSNSDKYLFADYVKSGRTDDALRKLDDLIRKDPNNSQPYALKGQIYESQGKLRDAKENYTLALKLNPADEIAANNMAWILADEGADLPTALAYAQSARKKQQDNPEIADTLGWIYYKMGSYALARDQVQFALSKQPTNSAFLYHLAMIYKANKQITEAQTTLKKALSSGKDFKEKSLVEAALKDLSQ